MSSYEIQKIIKEAMIKEKPENEKAF